MGAAVTALWLVTGAARGTLGHLVDTMNEPLPGVDVLRFATALNYTLLGQSGMAVFGTVHRRGLGRGPPHRRFGPLARVRRWRLLTIMIAAVVAQYGAFTTPLAIVWALCLAVAIWRQPSLDAS